MGAAAPSDAAQFYATEFPRLVAALDLYVGDLQIAQEIAQEAMLRAFQRWEHVRTLESPGGWTWRVAVNLANSHMRRRMVERRVRGRLAAAPLETVEDETGDAPEVRAAVAALPDKQRAAVVLRFFYDMSAGQAAALMSSSPEAVRQLTSRAVKQLRTDLGVKVDVAVEEAHDA